MALKYISDWSDIRGSPTNRFLVEVARQGEVHFSKAIVN